MNPDATIARAIDAETAEPIPSGTADSHDGIATVSADGFIPKSYAVGTMPAVVRLLSEQPALFANRISALPGDSLRLSISAPFGGRLALRRCHGERETYDLGTIEPTQALVPDDPFVANGLDWPQVSRVLPDAASGLWSLDLETPSGTASAPLVLRSSRPTPRILAVASVGTWACYNLWGGRSRYRNLEVPSETFNNRPALLDALLSRTFLKLPEPIRVRLKQTLGRGLFEHSWIYQPLSLRRPWGSYLGLRCPPDEPTLNHLAALDAKILHWFDRQGYQYEVAADLDAHSDERIFDSRSIVVLLGHSEYWSERMLRRLHEAHERGTWLANLSGNSLYREIGVDGDHSLHLKRLVTAGGAVDETCLTGVRLSEKAYGTAAPYTCNKPAHWAFGGTALSRGGRFGERCLIANVGSTVRGAYDPAGPTTSTGMLAGHGAAGFEVDRRIRRRRREFEVIATGAAPGSADMVVKEPRGSVGGAFSASSITFGGSLLVDDACATIVQNVIRRALQHAPTSASAHGRARSQ